MSAKQNNTRNTVKAVCIYSLLCAVCMVIGYVESLLDLSFIAPGVKPGLANSVACVLILGGDIKGAFAVNISRILLSALLFGSPVSFLFALAGGVLSLAVMSLISKTRVFSPVGVSIIGAVTHNLAQCAVGVVFLGVGVIYYLPLLLLSGTVCGSAVGVLSVLVLKRTGKGKNYV